MSDLTPETLAELRRLLDRSASRPWEWDDDRARPGLVTHRGSILLRCGALYGPPEPEAALIVAAVNALPALLDAAEDRALLAIAHRDILRMATDHADERDEIAGRLAELLCDLTGGRLSKTTYPVAVMVQEIEQHLSECHESDLKAERDELAATVARVRALHYAADNDAARTPICETCHGRAGVHECGCWAERDREPVCGHCREGHKGMSVAWPCPTIRALDARADR